MSRNKPYLRIPCVVNLVFYISSETTIVLGIFLQENVDGDLESHLLKLSKQIKDRISLKPTVKNFQ